MYRAKEKMLFLLVVVVVVFVAPALRAKVGGKITGVVRDQTGSVIPGAAVVVTNTASGVKQTTATDQDGVFTFPISSQVPINAVAGPI